MDDALAVRIGEGPAHLQRHVDGPVRRQRPALEQLGERAPREVLHDDVGRAREAPDVVDRDDAGMAETRRRHRLAREASGDRLDVRAGAAGVLPLERLDGHLAVELAIAGLVDDAHRALPEDAEQLVALGGDRTRAELELGVGGRRRHGAIGRAPRE